MNLICVTATKKNSAVKGLKRVAGGRRRGRKYSGRCNNDKSVYRENER